METITLAVAVIAVVEAVKKLVPTISGLLTIAVAVGVGAIAGYFHVLGAPDVISGAVAGLVAVGAHEAAREAGGM